MRLDQSYGGRPCTAETGSVQGQILEELRTKPELELIQLFSTRRRLYACGLLVVNTTLIEGCGRGR